MKKTRYFSLLSLLLGFTMFLTGCNEDDFNSALPRFAGFSITPETPSSGDSVTIQVVQLKKGKLLYKAIYEWKVTCNGELVYQPSTQTVTYDENPANPVIKFKMPATLSGECEVEYAGTYYYSGGAPSKTASTASSSNTYKGSINVTQSGLLYGVCKGSATFNVEAKE